ncbi:MAG: hypothetical protein ACYC7D_01695 [Nitrososphaerales archaeon]
MNPKIWSVAIILAMLIGLFLGFQIALANQKTTGTTVVSAVAYTQVVPSTLTIVEVSTKMSPIEGNETAVTLTLIQIKEYFANYITNKNCTSLAQDIIYSYQEITPPPIGTSGYFNATIVTTTSTLETVVFFRFLLDHIEKDFGI